MYLLALEYWELTTIIYIPKMGSLTINLKHVETSKK
jgi:hypothetical protein